MVHQVLNLIPGVPKHMKDPDIGIEWPLDRVDEIILSDKDKIWLGLNSLK